MGTVELRIGKLRNEATLPTRAREGGAELDLYACETAHLGPGERWSIGTGVAVEIPEGHAGLVLPRAESARERGVTLVDSPALLDAGHRGEVRVLLLNADPAEVFRVAPGDPIARLVVVPVAVPVPVEVEALGESSHGEGRFGSSGR